MPRKRPPFNPALDVCIIQRVVWQAPDARKRLLAGVYSYAGGERKLALHKEYLSKRCIWCAQSLGRVNADQWRAIVSGVYSMLQEIKASHSSDVLVNGSPS